MPGRRDRLGDLLQPDDLVGRAARQRGHLRRGHQRLGLEAGVDAQRREPGGAQEPPADLGGAQCGPVLQVLIRPGVRRQAEDRRAPAPDGQADLRVEQADPGEPGVVSLGEQGLEPGPVHVAADDPVAVVIDQRLVPHVRQQARRAR